MDGQRPPNVITLLSSIRPAQTSDALDLAAALRRVHEAGLGRGFVLVAPTPLADEPGLGEKASEDDALDWWSQVCLRFRKDLRVGVVIVKAAAGQLDPADIAVRSHPKTVAMPDLTRGERSALVELSRAVCTGDRGLLCEAMALGTPGLEPWSLTAMEARDLIDAVSPRTAGDRVTA